MQKHLAVKPRCCSYSMSPGRYTVKLNQDGKENSAWLVSKLDGQR